MAQLSLKKTIAKLMEWVRLPTVKRGLNQGDAFYISQRTDTGTKCGFGVGGGTEGVNHGIWSHLLNRWMIYGNTGTVYVNRILMDKVNGTATKSGSYITSGSISYHYNCGTVTVNFDNVTLGTISTSMTTIATIPAGYRPYTQVYGVFYDTSLNIFYVSADGSVKVKTTVSGKSGLYGSVTYIQGN